jgi:hypothetical protein
MAERLRLVKGVSLWTVGPDKKQFSFRKGHLGGSLDGIIKGVGRHTSEYHVWENKCCNIEKFNLLQKLKVDLGEGNALEKWDPTYFAQAQVYMYNFDIEYHYMTVCSPGSRNETSCITTLNPVAGKYYSEELVKEIVTAERPPSRISNNPAWFTCKFCDFHSVCHEAKIPEKNCRTCIHSTPTMDGKWTCTLYEKDLDDNAQRIGCDNHLFNPGLMAGTQTDAGDGWIEYAHPTGMVVRNTIGGGITTSTGSRG